MEFVAHTELSAEAARSRLAYNLRRFRGVIGISQERLALEAGVDRTMLSKIERQLTNPSLETLVKLSNRLRVDVSALLAPEPAAEAFDFSRLDR